jgi:hypothetical protein
MNLQTKVKLKPAYLCGDRIEEVGMIADNAGKILMVEEDPDTQANLCDILQLDGYRVESVMTVNEVLGSG